MILLAPAAFFRCRWWLSLCFFEPSASRTASPSRRCSIYGEGSSTKVVIKSNGHEFDPNEGKKPDLGADDIRYTTKGNAMYAFVQGWPGAEVILPALGTASDQAPAKVQNVSLLGGPTKLKFAQEAAGLRVTLPEHRPGASDIGVTIKLMTA